MRYVKLEDMSDSMWEASHKAYYSLELAREMGGVINERPPLQDFYNTMMDEIEAGRLIGWALISDENDEYLGHTVLVKPHGEWEVGTALVSKSDWGSGMGVRATLHALRYAFEEMGAKQVIAFALNPSGVSKDYLIRGGFRPFLNFLLMPVEVWESRWKGRVK